MGSINNNSPSTLKMKEEEETYCYAVQLATFSALPMTLKAAIELDIIDIVARASAEGKYLSAKEIAKELSTNNPDAHLLLERMLRLLTTYNIFTCIDEKKDGMTVAKRYGPAPVCKYFNKKGGGGSLAQFCLFIQDKVMMESWYFLKDVVMEGGTDPFCKAHGAMFFDYLDEDLRFKTIFNAGMSNPSIIIMNKILESYSGFKELGSVVDVGGGVGTILNMIVSKYPSIKGINFDLPHVISEAPSFPGVEHRAGDMFESVPNGDAIFMKWILHDWSDECCFKLLNNCWKALPETGKVIVVESLLSPSLEPSLAAKNVAHFDMLMLANTSGKERTELEYKLMAKKAGFSGFKVACGAANIHVLEFSK